MQKLPAVAHWSSDVHALPSASFGSHVLFIVLQNALAAQSVSVAHVALHEPIAHAYGVQSTLFCTHPPPPLQSCPVAAFPLQELAPHDVPAGQSAQPPLPSHLPSVPHPSVEVTGQLSLCGFVCAAAGPHVPSFVPDCLSAAAHARQSPLQALSQQTPSTH
jgi:hypothetical protein